MNFIQKPRTVTGWKGLINDPDMDGGHDVHRGLHTARLVPAARHRRHRPAGGLRMARPDHAAIHRRHGDLGRDRRADHRKPGPPPCSSPPACPCRSGSRTVPTATCRAVDACLASAAGHTFFGVTPNGVAAVVTTAGNADTHVILRGGRSGPNYGASHTAKALDLIAAAWAAAPPHGRR